MPGKRGQGALTKLAVFFKNKPNQFVNGLDLAPIAGSYAWRSRVAELRTKMGMDIENRQRIVDGFTISEYQFHSPSRSAAKRRVAQNQHTKPAKKQLESAPAALAGVIGTDGRGLDSQLGLF
jgi:hypothetical protein